MKPLIPTESPHEAYERGRREERDACAMVADSYADENIRMAQDTIILDPCLSGGPFTPANMEASRRHQIDGCIHSSMFHAAQNIAAAIRLRSLGGGSRDPGGAA